MIVKIIIYAISSLAFLWMSIMTYVKGYDLLPFGFFFVFCAFMMMAIAEYAHDHPGIET